MGHCARKLHSLAAARASRVLAVLTQFDYSPIHESRRPSRDRASPLRYCRQNQAD
jgi:hypothetical protein